MLWHLPLEPFQLRYTADWYSSFKKEYADNNVEFYYIDGESLTDKLEKGRFLDIYNTIYWKSTQMARVAKLFREGRIQDGDVFLTTDLWHPGFESISYMARLSGIKVKSYGILHAGTYDPHDFTAQAGLAEVGADLHESGWMQSCDKIFVSTQYHKDLICEARDVDPNSVVVTGIPFYGKSLALKYSDFTARKVKNRVVFPNRLDKEKNPHLFDMLAEALGPEYECIKTMDNFTTKDNYYKTLASASVVVSFSDQETFGYAMLESAALGCSLVVPDMLSYTEMYPEANLYRGFEDAVDKVKQFCENPQPIPVENYERYAQATKNMLREMELI